jgi:hypothetical protein
MEGARAMPTNTTNPGMFLATYLPMLFWLAGSVLVLVYMLRLLKRLVVAVEKIASDTARIADERRRQD